ncbi:MAG: glycosyltransferase family 4 protein [Bacteroidota bacterium]|nr:glycosyltransferase family 4 protein [Bacteroidota bacterium]
MRIGVVSAHYMPEIGYQEVHLAKAYARLGHTVKVFTSTASVNLGGDIANLNYKKGVSIDTKYNYEIERLPSLSFKSKALPFGLKRSVAAFKPDVLVILGVAKIFPAALLSKHFFGNVKIVSVYGDAKEYLDRGTFQQKIKTAIHEFGYSTIKYPLYRKAIKYGDKLILNIPETNQLFLDFLKGKDKVNFESKKVMLNLGYDPDEYYFKNEDRISVRKELNIKDDEIVIITSTRVNKRKNLEQIIQLVSKLNVLGKKVTYIIVGFLGDEYEQELKLFINKQPFPNAFKCFPFLNAKEIRKLYCAADAGMWLKVAISIQEAMGTGLPVILENKSSVNHLIEDGKNGWFFTKDTFNDIIEKVVNLLSENNTNREQLTTNNAKMLSYDVIAKKILDSVTDKSVV